MADNLDDLLLDDEEMPPAQRNSLNTYLGPSKKSKSKSGWKDTSKWKLIGAAVITFALLANPWVQGMMDNVPYLGGNDLTVTLFATVLFAIAMTCFVFFL